MNDERMTELKPMTGKDAMNAIMRDKPIVIESRKYGIVANRVAAADREEFSGWLCQRVQAGAYPAEEYGYSWRAWSHAPEPWQMDVIPWKTGKKCASGIYG